MLDIFHKQKESTDKNILDELNEDDILFLISLYPKGRSVKSIFNQLKEKYPNTRDARISAKVNEWSKKMNTLGIVTVIDTEDIGKVIFLTKNGKRLIQYKIASYRKSDTEKFVKILNRLLTIPDPWAIEYYRQIATFIVKRNIQLFTIIFDFKTIDRVVADLKDTFGMHFDEERSRNFKESLEHMETLGLIDIEYHDDNTYIGATSTSREIISEITDTISSNISKTQAKKKSMWSKTDSDLLISTGIAIIFSIILIALLYPVLIINGYSIYSLCLLPILVLLSNQFYKKIRISLKLNT